MRKEATRAQLLVTARKLFASQGFEATTIRAVAAASGVAAGTVLAHFPDKGSLLIAAMLDDLGRLQEQAFTSLPRRARLERQLSHLTDVFYRYYARNPALSRTLLKQMWFVPGAWGEALLADATGFVSRVAALMAAAQARGELRPDADCSLAATTFFAQYLFVLMGALSAERFDRRAATATLALLWRQQLSGLVRGSRSQ